MKIISVTFTLNARPLSEDKKKTDKQTKKKTTNRVSLFDFHSRGRNVLGKMKNCSFHFPWAYLFK